LRLQDAKSDLYRRMAKREGYRSRASYKLIQIDDKYRILREGYVVLDIGCAPGGWLQVCSERVGVRGFTIGVDLKTVKPVAENVVTLIADIMDPAVGDEIVRRLPRKADVILSDLAPNVSGVWRLDHLKQIDLTLKVVSLMPILLRKGGYAVLKVFEGESTRDVFRTVEQTFDRISVVKPAASRGKSSELYFVCIGYRESSSAG